MYVTSAQTEQKEEGGSVPYDLESTKKLAKASDKLGEFVELVLNDPRNEEEWPIDLFEPH